MASEIHLSRAERRKLEEGHNQWFDGDGDPFFVTTPIREHLPHASPRLSSPVGAPRSPDNVESAPRPPALNLLDFNAADLVAPRQQWQEPHIHMQQGGYDFEPSENLAVIEHEGAELWEQLARTPFGRNQTLAEHLIQIYVSSAINASTAAQVESHLDITINAGPLPSNYPTTAKKFFSVCYCFLIFWGTDSEVPEVFFSAFAVFSVG